MVDSLQAKNFQGMNNVLRKSPLDMPTIQLNAHTTREGTLIKRPGISLVANLPGAHSLWTDSQNNVTFCMAKGSLYRLVNMVPELLTSTGQADSPTHYISLSGSIYISNSVWTGVYNIKAGTVGTWGIPVPVAPILAETTGSLPVGTYHVCFTVTDSTGRPSGNSTASSITLTSPSGISILNLPANATVWLTVPNGSQFFYAGNYATITNVIDSSEPLPTMWGSPPLPMSHLCWAFGRMWGFNKTKLYYSEAYQPELFQLSHNYFECDSLGGFIAKTNQGLYLGLQDRTVFLQGRSPSEMVEMIEVAPGIVPGSLCYASDLGELGTNIPVWIGKKGIYAGTANGQVRNLIQDKIQLTAEQSQAASIYRVVDGQSRMLFSYQQGGSSQDMALGDDASCEIIRKGAVL